MIYKREAGSRLKNDERISSFETGHGQVIHMLNQGYSLNDRSAIVIQRHWKGYRQRKKYEKLLIE